MKREEIKAPKQELKTGHWIIIDDCEFFIAECSECGKRVDSRMINKYSYCACGAKMHNGKFMNKHTNKATEQEDKLGKWIEVDTNMYSCDKCNNCFTLVPEDNNISQFNYCPKCGTKTDKRKGSNMIHELKILPKWFEGVVHQKKTFEIRKNDRNYNVGDTLILKEWYKGKYTGREVKRTVSYIYYGDGTYGLSDEYVVMAIEPLEQESVLDKIKDYINHIRNTGLGKKKSLEFIEKYIDGLKVESEE